MSRLKFALLIVILCVPMTLLAQDRPTLERYATGETLVIINTPRLNVRSLPSAENQSSIIHTIVKRGERYPALAKTEDEEWILIRISGDTAWVLADGVLITNPERIPIFGQVTPEEDEAMRQLTAQLVAYINSTVGVRNNLNIRLAPGIQFPIIGRIPYPERAYPLYATTSGQWYQVNYQNTVGWVNAVYVTFPSTIIRPVITFEAQG